jgi:hypothetical protein
MESSSGVQLQGTESEGSSDGEEFRTPEKESSDEETTQDRNFVDNAPQDAQNPLVMYGGFNAALRSDSESEDYSQLVKGRFKPCAPRRSTNPGPRLRTGHRARVLQSAPNSSADESGTALQDQSQAAAEGDMGCEGGASPESSSSSCGSGVSSPIFSTAAKFSCKKSGARLPFLLFQGAFLFRTRFCEGPATRAPGKRCHGQDLRIVGSDSGITRQQQALLTF